MRLVVKFGTNVVAAPDNTINKPRLLDMVRQLAYLHNAGHELVLVSSGAVFVGRQAAPTLPQRKDIPFKQMLAAIGQVKLMNIYERLFDIYDIRIAQALLTRVDLVSRSGYLNARNTLDLLLKSNVLPIVNENDVVGVEEIKIGDNDNLSALIANLIDADKLIMLTDQRGLFTADPREDNSARLIAEVPEITPAIRELAGGTNTGMGVGGMSTKIQAADLATRSGVEAIIASGHQADVLVSLIEQKLVLGTRFPAKISSLESRKRRLLAEKLQGEVLVDTGAAQALARRQSSLLPAGVVGVRGQFPRGATVVVKDEADQPICRGVVNYKAADITALQGVQSEQIETLLGFNYGNTIIHKNNMVILTR